VRDAFHGARSFLKKIKKKSLPKQSSLKPTQRNDSDCRKIAFSVLLPERLAAFAALHLRPPVFLRASPECHPHTVPPRFAAPESVAPSAILADISCMLRMTARILLYEKTSVKRKAPRTMFFSCTKRCGISTLLPGRFFRSKTDYKCFLATISSPLSMRVYRASLGIGLPNR
jgi:hypothetical protein